MVFRLGLGTVLTALGLLAITASLHAFAGYREWRSAREAEERKRSLYDSLGQHSFHYAAETTDARIELKFRYQPDETAQYQLLFTCREGVKVFEPGEVVIEFLDAEGYQLHQHSFNEWTTPEGPDSISDARLPSVLTSRGVFWLPVSSMVNVHSIEMAHGMQMLHARHWDGSEDVGLDTSNEEVDKWDLAVRQIRVGMTYREMLETAGKPKTTARVSGFDVAMGYRGMKYNYGRKWVFFGEDDLIKAIR